MIEPGATNELSDYQITMDTEHLTANTTNNTDNPGISIIVPVYGCVDCLKTLCKRLHHILHTITNRFEIILVDDRSPDNSWKTILELQRDYPQVTGLRLSRNFGQQIAITAGLSVAKGDYAVVMDCDLQDPPEKIPELFAKLNEGYDLVLARRTQRHHSTLRLLAAKSYFRLLSYLSGEAVDGRNGSFSILSRKVIDTFLEFGERERHYLFILRWLGFNAGSIEIEHCARPVGESAYSYRALMHHAIDGIFFQSTVFLNFIVQLGLLFAFSGLVLAGVFIVQYFQIGSVPGWTSLVVLLLVCTGVILLSLGVIGLYIGKIFDQAKARPLFLIDEVSEQHIHGSVTTRNIAATHVFACSSQATGSRTLYRNWPGCW